MSASTPLFELLARRLTTLLPEQYRDGDRLPPEPELCRQLGVSLMTLREALAILHSQGLIQKRRGSGNYFSPRPGKNRHIAVLIPWPRWPQAVVSPSLQILVEKLLGRLEADQHTFGLYLGRQELVDNVYVYRFPELHQALSKGEVSLAIKFLGRLHPESERALAHTGIPLCGNMTNADIRVSHDLPGGIRDAVGWLAQQGRKRIAYMDILPRSEDSTVSSRERFSAYCEALLAARLPVVPEWVQRDFHPAQSGAGWSNVREIWTSHQEKPDALLLSSESFFADTSAALKTLGIRVPEQLLLVSQRSRGLAFNEEFPCAFIETDPDAYASVLGGVIEELLSGKAPEKRTCWIPTRLKTEAFSTSPSPGKTNVVS